jgi:hypothetical protein
MWWFAFWVILFLASFLWHNRDTNQFPASWGDPSQLKMLTPDQQLQMWRGKWK